MPRFANKEETIIQERRTWLRDLMRLVGKKDAVEVNSAHNHIINGTAASAGAHAHTVGIGAHSHSVSGTTANTGSGIAINVINDFIKLMCWYRSA